MTGPVDRLFDFHADALKLRAHRQQLLASNIANADTPGYKARDLDFARALRVARGEAAEAPRLVRTSSRHLVDARGEAMPEALFRQVVQPSLDGNSVDMDVERGHFADNALRYEASLMFLNSRIRSLMAALQG